MKQFLSSKLVASIATLAVVATVAIMSTTHPAKVKTDAGEMTVLDLPCSEAAGGCAYTLTPVAPPHESFVSMEYSNHLDGSVTMIYECGSEIGVTTGDAVQITWDSCENSSLGGQGTAAAIIRCVSCPNGQAKPAKTLMMTDGFYSNGWIVSSTSCGKSCDITATKGWKGGDQCSSGQ